tara:strand:+ start:330 stop:431 length:102 start_codon:yes stop_codon:yes gene_type:complete
MTAAYGLGMFAYGMICLAIGVTIIYLVINRNDE